MIPRSHILATLQASSAVVAIAGTRLYASAAPAGVATPLVVWSLVASTPNPTHEAITDFGRHLFQFDCQAATLAEAAVLAEAVQLALEGGSISCSLDSTRDGISEDTGSFIVSIDIAFQS